MWVTMTVEILNSLFTIQIQPSFHSQPPTLTKLHRNKKTKITSGKTKSQGENTSEITTQILLAQSWKCFLFFHPYVSRWVFSVLLQYVRDKSHENLEPSKSPPQLHASKSSETFQTRSIPLQLHFRQEITKVENIIMYQKALLQTWMCIV